MMNLQLNPASRAKFLRYQVFTVWSVPVSEDSEKVESNFS